MRRPPNHALLDTTEGRFLVRLIEEWGLDRALPPIALRLLGLANQLSRYSVVSAIALAIDISVFLALTAADLPPAFAGTTGYAVGLLAHFALSTRFVFKQKDAAKSETRLLAEFSLSGLAGLAITAAVIGVATGSFGLSPLAAKLCAVAASTIAVFLIRRTVVFAAGDQAASHAGA